MQGQNAPWCVGSVFFPPQLLTSDVGPLVFNQLGNPQCLLSTGQRLEQSGTPISKSKQIENVMQGIGAAFIPRDLLEDNFEVDAATHDGGQLHGNLLQGLKCSDGSVLTFFPCGEGADRIASTLYHRGASGRWSSVRTSVSSQGLGDSDKAGWPESPSLQHSIQQLSAVWAHLSGNGGEEVAIVAARSTYHAFFSTISREEERVQFVSTAVSKFEVPVAHITWNPHISGEAAVILESGVVCLFDVQASGSGNSGRLVDLIAKATIRSPLQRFPAKPSSHLGVVRQNQEQGHDYNEPGNGSDQQNEAADPAEKLPELERKWWCCEFGWLPQTLLVANSEDVYLVDMTDKQNCSNPMSESSGRANVDAQASLSGIDIVASVGSSDSSRFCPLQSGKENILAFGKDPNGGMYEYEFSVATENHVLLFDTRQPQTPILQWEHGMRQDPPRLLIMCPLSALRSFDDHDKSMDIPNGRVILAVSFKSGVVRVFCYGSEVSRFEPLLGNSSKRQKVESHDWGNATQAWDISSRLYAPLADVDDWKDVVRSSKGLYSQNVRGMFVPESHKGQQNIAGIMLLSDSSTETWHGGKRTFTIMQLTGRGDLLAQSFESSYQLQDPSKAMISTVDDMSDAEDAEESTGLHRPRHYELKYEVLPAFLKYMHTGSILAPPPSNNFKKADHAEGAVIPDQDGTSGEAINKKWTNLDSSVFNSKAQKNRYQAALKAHLQAFLQDLNVPLTMYEVAQKVLGMGLPEGLVFLAPDFPLDLKAQRHVGSKLPSESPLLGNTASGNGRGGDDHEDQILVSNSLTRKRSFQGTVPLPLLLEVQNIEEKANTDPSSANGGRSEKDPHESGDISHCSVPEEPPHINVAFEGGKELLLEGTQYLEGLIEELVSKNEPTVIPLSEPTQDSQGNLNDGSESHSNILLYLLPERVGAFNDSHQRDPGKLPSVNAADRATDTINVVKFSREVEVNDLKKQSSSFSDDIHKKFVVRKASPTNEERRPAEQYLKIDPNLCPVKLSFSAPDCDSVDTDEELGQGELSALGDLQSDFLQWQQSFPPYRNSY